MDERVVVVRLRAEIQQYKEQLAAAKGAAKALSIEFDKDGQRIETGFKRLLRASQVYRSEWESLTSTATKFGVAGMGALTLAAKSAVQWESAWAGVLKTVDGTPEQLNRLEDDLRSMTREVSASHTEIAAVAEQAGQLGVAVGDVTAFTRVMIDLGETTNLAASEAATTLARLMNIMGTAPDRVTSLGNVIVALGNNSATTEREIADMALRLAAASRQAGLTEADTLALASSLSSVGVEAEAGGTAVSKVITRISDSVKDGGKDLEVFAKVAGISAADFKRAYQTDAASAVAMFIEGMGRMSASGQSTTAVFEELQLTDERLKRAVLSLGSAQGLLTDQLRLANREWVDGNALMVEAAKRYETSEARMQMARNSINDAAITLGEVFLPAITGAADAISKLASWFAETDGPLRDLVGWSLALGTAILLVGGGAMGALPRIVALRDAYLVLAAASSRAATAMKIASVSMGAIGAVLGLATIAATAFGASSARAKEQVRELAATLDEATGAITENTRVTVYNELVASGAAEAAKLLGIGLDELTDAALGNAEAIEAVTAARHAQSNAIVVSMSETRNLTIAERDVLNAVTKVGTAIADQNAKLDASQEKWADQQVAMKGGADGYGRVESAVSAASIEIKSMNELLKESIDLQRKQAGVALSQWDAVTQFAKALDAAAESIATNGATLDEHTEAGRKNRDALADIVDATWDKVEADAAAGESTVELEARMQEGRDAFIATATQMGLTADEAEVLADKMGLIPAAVTSEVKLIGYDAALGKVDQLKAAMAGVSFAMVGGPVQGKADGGPIHGPGSETSDSILIAASNNEYMMRASAHRMWGTPAMDAINAGDVNGLMRAISARGFRDGGSIGHVSFTASAPVVNIAPAAGGGGTVELSDHSVRALGDYMHALSTAAAVGVSKSALADGLFSNLESTGLGEVTA